MSNNRVSVRLAAGHIRWGSRLAVVVLAACVLVPALVVAAEAHDGHAGGGSGVDVAALAELAGNQEALLNAYRCMFAVDVEAVAGGCDNGAPAGPVEFPVPAAGGAVEVAALSHLVGQQEALLNAYRCMFAVDVEIVPGGCDNRRPAASPVAGDEAEGTGAEIPVDCSGSEYCLNSFSGRGGSRWCGLREDRTVICNAFGDLGLVANEDYSDSDVVLAEEEHFGSPTGEFLSVSAGLFFACGLRPDFSAVCWEHPRRGQSTDVVAVPEGRFASVSAGIAFHEFSCGLREDRTVVCWGDEAYNRSGRLDAPEGRFLTVSAGWEHACGIREDRTVLCWGDNKHGRIEAPAGLFLSVSAGFWFSCGIREDRTAVCWGLNERRGYNAPEGRFLSVSAGQGLACGVREDQTAVCWGPRGFGEPWGELDSPEGRFASVSAGPFTSCGLRPDGTLECWGEHETTWPISGRFEVHVYYCAAEGKYTLADLEYETDRMNQVVAPFYHRESTGLSDIEFIPAGIVSPDIDWDLATISAIYESSRHLCNPKASSATYPQADRYNVLSLVDVSFGEPSDPCNVACGLRNQVIMPTVEALYASEDICLSSSLPRLVRELPGHEVALPGVDSGFGNIRAGTSTSCRDLAYWVYDYLVAHELGHTLFSFGHPIDCSIMSFNPWACPPRISANMDDALLTPNLLQTAFIGCAERHYVGWPRNPERCPREQVRPSRDLYCSFHPFDLSRCIRGRDL